MTRRPGGGPAAWGRAVGLSRRAFGRIDRASKVLWGSAGVALGLVAAVHLAAVPIPIALLVSFAAAAGVLVTSAIVFRDTTLRAAVELFSSHQLREMREFRTVTGSRMPRGGRPIERWLVAHPTGPGRGSLLAVLGRFAEAADALGPEKADNDADLLAVDIHRETIVLLSGRSPDIAGLKRTWAALPDTTRRGEVRECIAVLEAQASQRGKEPLADPIAILAAARPESAPAMGQARLAISTATMAAIPLVVSVAITALRLVS